MLGLTAKAVSDGSAKADSEPLIAATRDTALDQNYPSLHTLY